MDTWKHCDTSLDRHGASHRAARHLEKSQRWIAANAAGWLLSLPWTFALPAMLPETAAIAVWVATFIIAGILMGLTVSLVTGVTLVRFERKAEAKTVPVLGISFALMPLPVSVGSETISGTAIPIEGNPKPSASTHSTSYETRTLR
jgi:hypothetical protein